MKITRERDMFIPGDTAQLLYAFDFHWSSFYSNFIWILCI